MQPSVFSKKNIVEFTLSSLESQGGVIIPVDKPYRWTSQDVVKRIKYALRNVNAHTIKIGHAGTLDPLATGLLIICIGRATKLSEEIQAEKKEYLASFTLGATTPSFDREHPVDKVFDTSGIGIDDIRRAAESLQGEKEQIPPMFSAKYINGERSYYLARRGEEAALKPSHINVYKVEIMGVKNIGEDDFSLSHGECGGTLPYTDSAGRLRFVVKKHRFAEGSSEDYADEDSSSLLSGERLMGLPVVTLKICCSKGTYIRAIARDFGAELGCGAFLSALRRVRNGNFTIDDAVTFDDLVRKINSFVL